MSKSKKNYVPKKKSPQLCLIVDLNQTPDPLNELTAAITATPIVSVLIQTNDTSTIQPLVTAIQAHNVAVVLEDDAEAVKTLNADGVHITSQDLDQLDDAKTLLGEDYIFGIVADNSRHKSMQSAEKGASYVAIELEAQEPSDNEDEPKEENERPPSVAWWISLFEIPCIAWNIDSIEQVLKAQTIGADYIALTPSIWQKGEATASTIAKLQNTLKTELKQAEIEDES